LAGLFAAGEKPTGSRDPYGLRRAAQGVIKVLADFEHVTGTSARPSLGPMLARARVPFGTAPSSEEMNPLREFFMDRLRHLMQAREFQHEEIQAVTGDIERIETVSPADLI